MGSFAYDIITINFSKINEKYQKLFHFLILFLIGSILVGTAYLSTFTQYLFKDLSVCINNEKIVKCEFKHFYGHPPFICNNLYFIIII
jgi:hypothetical protein